MGEVKPLRLRMQIRNNRMVRAREELGCQTAAEYCRRIGFDPRTYGSYESLKKSPLRPDTASCMVCVVPGCRAVTGVNRCCCYAHGAQESAQRESLPKIWSFSAVRLAERMGFDPGYLWPECVRLVRDTRTVDVEVSTDEARMLADPILRSTLAAAMAALPERERKVLELRFGLVDGVERTLDEIAEVLPAVDGDGTVSRERAAEIGRGAIRILRRRITAQAESARARGGAS